VNSAWKFILPVLCLPLVAADDLFLFRGDFIYVLPPEIGTQMLKHAPRDQWRHYPEHTRYIDEDNDGQNDYVAIAAGASGGFGMQLRYRLRQQANGKNRLGRWYWYVITDNTGGVVTEKFNP